MKFKLDENFGLRAKKLFLEFNHDVHSVVDEQLQGCPDESLFSKCVSENRCLVTLDLDFCDVIRFPPEKSKGIVVIRFPSNPTLAVLELLCKQFLEYNRSVPIGNELWIIEIGRIRIHQNDEMV